jgi:hypothetical protein
MVPVARAKGKTDKTTWNRKEPYQNKHTAHHDIYKFIQTNMDEYKIINTSHFVVG